MALITIDHLVWLPVFFLQVCTSGWDYEFDQTEWVKTCSTGLLNILKSLLLQNWIEWPMAYSLFKLPFFFFFEYPQLQRCFWPTRDNKHKKINLEKSNRKITSVELKHWCGKKGFVFLPLKMISLFCKYCHSSHFHKKFMLAVAKEFNS